MDADQIVRLVLVGRWYAVPLVSFGVVLLLWWGLRQGMPPRAMGCMLFAAGTSLVMGLFNAITLQQSASSLSETRIVAHLVVNALVEVVSAAGYVLGLALLIKEHGHGR